MAVSFSADAGIGTITLDKPPANSYDLEYVQRQSWALDMSIIFRTLRMFLRWN